MKRNSTITSIVLLTTLLLSITVKAQNSVAFVGGVNLSKIKADDVRGDATISNKTTFSFGFEGEFSIGHHLFIQAGTEYCGKGYKAKDADGENNTSLDYIQVPVKLLFKAPIGTEERLQLLVGAGPYIGFGIAYKAIITSFDPASTNPVTDEEGNFGDYALQTTDLGLQVLAGIQIGKKFQVTMEYQPGLRPVFYSVDLGIVKNRVMGLRIAYLW